MGHNRRGTVVWGTAIGAQEQLGHRVNRGTGTIGAQDQLVHWTNWGTESIGAQEQLGHMTNWGTHQMELHSTYQIFVAGPVRYQEVSGSTQAAMLKRPQVSAYQ